MAGITLDPSIGTPGTLVNVSGTGFDPKIKFNLQTVDANGVISGYNINGEPTNINRSKRDGTFSIGIYSPPLAGISKIQALQNNLVVASANFTGQPQSTTVSTATDSAEFVRQVNVIRAANNLKPVVQNQIAFQAAVDSVTHSANTGDGTHHDWIHPLLGTSTASAIGEVLYKSTNLAPAISNMITAWMNSAEHKAIMLSPLFDMAGGAFSRTSSGTVYGAMEWIGGLKTATTTPTGTALPSSIANSTTTVDVQLRDWLMSLPDNATALLGSAQLKLASQLKLENRGPIRIEAQNSLIKCINRTATEIILISYGSRGIQWFGGTIEGSNPYPGRRQPETYEHNHAFGLRGVMGVEVGNVKIRNVGGDFFYLAGGYVSGGGFRHGTNYKIHDIDAQGNGRMGIAMLDGLDGFEIYNSVMGGITWYGLDIENNGHIFSGVPAGVTNGHIHNVNFGPIPYGRGPLLSPLSSSPGSEPSGISFAITGASSGGVNVLVDHIEVDHCQTTDPSWPDFRVGIYTPATYTTNINLHDNIRQVKV